jgi:hypothetical protein
MALPFKVYDVAGAQQSDVEMAAAAKFFPTGRY